MTTASSIERSEAFAAYVVPNHKISQHSKDAGVITIVRHTGIALAAVGSLALTNNSLSYNVHYESALTNPIVSLPNHEDDWFDEESPVLSSFLGFLDSQMESHPELVISADEDQLARIETLVAGVRL